MLFPTAYFPSIAYVQAMCKWGEVTLDCHEHWVKQSIRNRCAILNAAGRQNLIIPIIHGATKTPVGQIQVDDTKNWRSHHWKSFQTAYGKSPFFEYYEQDVLACLNFNSPNLMDLNLKIMQVLIEVWELPIKLRVSHEFHPYEYHDYRNLDWLSHAFEHRSYMRVFSHETVNTNNLSTLDLLCCEGPLGRNLILSEQN